jgi:hypothetical protein
VSYWTKHPEHPSYRLSCLPTPSLRLKQATFCRDLTRDTLFYTPRLSPPAPSSIDKEAVVVPPKEQTREGLGVLGGLELGAPLHHLPHKADQARVALPTAVKT